MLAKKLSTHPLKPLLEELVRGIKQGISHLEDEQSCYPNITIMDIARMGESRLSDVLRDCQSRHGPNYTITRAYTASIAFRTSQCTRMTSYDCVFYHDGEEHGISFLPHEGLFDILGYEDK